MDLVQMGPFSSNPHGLFFLPPLKPPEDHGLVALGSTLQLWWWWVPQRGCAYVGAAGEGGWPCSVRSRMAMGQHLEEGRAVAQKHPREEVTSCSRGTAENEQG